MLKIATLDVNQIVTKKVVFLAYLKALFAFWGPVTPKLKLKNSVIFQMIDIFNTLLTRYSM